MKITTPSIHTVKLKQLQTLLNARSGVIPIVTSSTDDGVVLVFASTIPLTNLTKEAIEGLGLSENVITEGLKAKYVEVPQLIPITVPKEVVVTVPLHDVVYEQVSKDEVIKLKPIYEVVRQDIPIYQGG